MKNITDQSTQTPQDIHRDTVRLFDGLHQYTFSNLPLILDKLIQDKAWSKLPTPFKNFGEYALHQGVDGLCIDSNEKLWLLRCALDFEGKHIIEWKDVLEEVSAVVKVTEKGKLPNRSVSLEKLAKLEQSISDRKITYYPKRASGKDRSTLELAMDKSILQRIASGKITKKEALNNSTSHASKIDSLKKIFIKLDDTERSIFMQWLKQNHFNLLTTI